MRDRIERVIAGLRLRLQPDGGDIELVEIRERRAVLHLSGKCATCPSSHLSLRVGAETAIREEVPELEELIVEAASQEAEPSRFDPLLDAAVEEPRAVIRERFAPESVVVGRSAKMRGVFEFVKVIAGSDSSVLITGESGTGKELIANVIHHASARRHRPFVAVSCAILAETLIESELFGHDRGAFTNAFKDRPGRFELADGGTLFLDDIDDVPLSMQVKLLRVLQTRTVERVGGTRAIPVDVRVLTGSKRDLHKLAAAGSFREDLLYRLNVIPVHLPPLRERAEDIPLLVEHFLQRYFRSRGKTPRTLSQAMLDAFCRYPWPGNVRELENACERIAQTCICDAVVAGCVPAGILFHAIDALTPAAGPLPTAAPLPLHGAASLDQRLHDFEIGLIADALRAAGGNKSKAAGLLQVKRSTLGDRIKKLGLVHLESPDAGSS